MSLVKPEFVNAVNECLELSAAIDTHHDPEGKAALMEKFVVLYEKCDSFGKNIIEHTKGLASQKGKSSEYIKGCKDVIEAYLSVMGTLRSTKTKYESVKDLVTKNAVKSNRAKDEEEPMMKKAA